MKYTKRGIKDFNQQTRRKVLKEQRGKLKLNIEDC